MKEYDVVRVAVLDRAEELPQALLHLERVHPVRVALEVLEDGALDKLEDEVQLALAPEDLDQVDDVVVLELLRRAEARRRAWDRSGALRPSGARELRAGSLRRARRRGRRLASGAP